MTARAGRTVTVDVPEPLAAGDAVSLRYRAPPGGREWRAALLRVDAGGRLAAVHDPDPDGPEGPPCVVAWRTREGWAAEVAAGAHDDADRIGLEAPTHETLFEEVARCLKALAFQALR